jgi:hypothetical protein
MLQLQLHNFKLTNIYFFTQTSEHTIFCRQFSHSSHIQSSLNKFACTLLPRGREEVTDEKKSPSIRIWTAQVPTPGFSVDQHMPATARFPNQRNFLGWGF